MCAPRADTDHVCYTRETDANEAISCSAGGYGGAAGTGALGAGGYGAGKICSRSPIQVHSFACIYLISKAIKQFKRNMPLFTAITNIKCSMPV